MHLPRALGGAAWPGHHPGAEITSLTVVNNRRGPRGQHQSFSDVDKPLYTISVAAEILDTHPRTLMLYEDARLIEPHRTTTNRRRYSQRDISKVQVIQHLTREKGVTLAGVRHILSLFDVMKKHRVEPPAELREIYDRYAQLI
ncbi:MAG: MerR family transcriptional regulator [Chloroflexi bacterium]|nr:MAG: MerR family transcriptional regulator [Chloroflexota bacterium]TMD74110.1 MAG: MerR family transcriptional regulator [Chloroflexota bacterium]